MSILAGLDAIFDHHLQVGEIGSVPHYVHRKSAKKLSTPPTGFNPRALMEAGYLRLVENLKNSPRLESLDPSSENWRFKLCSEISTNNKSPEVILERWIARQKIDDWANQVPAASGLLNSHADKRRAVDLVHRLKPGRFQFVELKCESDTPLRAAVEITQYALLYLLAREHYSQSPRADKELLRANTVDLRVLAPPEYYEDYPLVWLAREFAEGLHDLSRRKLGQPLIASFAFIAFASGFNWRTPSGHWTDVWRDCRPVWDAEIV